MRFVLVAHSWFMDSNGFTMKQIDAKSHKAAKEAAVLFKHELHRPFNNTEVVVLKIRPTETMLPRKLTWRERFRGCLD